MTDINTLERVGLEALKTGQLKLARQTFEQILDIDANHAPTLHKLGFVLLELQEPKGAAAVLSNFLRLEPEHNDARVGYAMALMMRGEAEEALRAGLSVLEKQPGHIPAIRLTAAAAMHQRKWGILLRIATQWNNVAPDDPAAINHMALAYFERNEFELAKDTYKKLLNAHPDDPRILTTYARSCLACFDYKNTLAALEKAQSLTAPTAEMLYTLSRARMFMGDLKGAEQACLKAISADPAFALAYSHLATLRRGAVEPPFVEKMRILLDDVSVADEQRASLNFALGQISERETAFEEAMRYFDAGNAISHTLLEKDGAAYDSEGTESLSTREKNILKALPEWDAPRPEWVTPIFIVGMPRSGTTLVESIIASHSEAFGAGESDAMPRIHASLLNSDEDSDLDEESLLQWRKDYLEAIRKRSEKPFVVDKQPLNFRSVGLLKKLFPESIIIHIRRNPVDTGMSIYRNDFGKAWPFATRWQDIAHFYGEYARTIEFWEQNAPSDFLTIQYEQLVNDFEGEARRLIEACGMEWQDECLAFHQAKRPVATFSSMQVREPIREKTISAHEQYGQLLNPLIEGLKEAGVDLETGALS